MRRDVGTAFAAVAGVVNAAALIAIVVTWTPYGMVPLLAGNLGGLPMLWWARASLTRRLVGAPAGGLA